MNAIRKITRRVSPIAVERGSWLIVIAAFVTACLHVGVVGSAGAYVLATISAAAIVALVVAS